MRSVIDRSTAAERTSRTKPFQRLPSPRLSLSARYIRDMRAFSGLLLAFVSLLPLAAQDVKPKDVRDAAKSGPSAIPTLQGYLKNRPPDVRAEAVKQLTEIGTAASLDPLMLATQDDDQQIQILATDGLVNFYSPGY